ncbi:unnamed protein product [Amoebophrya sp. A120]|nr:unnamed protein product [Amoebophrya sp. A120]|eukprot:GSA120T00010955001.1
MKRSDYERRSFYTFFLNYIDLMKIRTGRLSSPSRGRGAVVAERSSPKV